MGVSTNPWGSLPFPSPLPVPFPLPPLPLSPSPSPLSLLSPEAGGCCVKVGGINPPPLRGCGKLPGSPHYVLHPVRPSVYPVLTIVSPQKRIAASDVGMGRI